MRVKNSVVVAAVGLGTALSAGDVAADPSYIYYGPVIARNGGSTCHGGTKFEEAWLRHNVYGAEVNPSMPGGEGFAALYCPISRRNVSAYYAEPASSGDKVDLDTVDVWVKHTPSGNLGKWLGCQVSAQGVATGSSYFSASKYACATDGGCSAKDTVTTGYRHLRFSRPLSANAITGLFLTNLVIGCSVPRGASVIGSVSTFPTW